MKGNPFRRAREVRRNRRGNRASPVRGSTESTGRAGERPGPRSTFHSIAARARKKGSGGFPTGKSSKKTKGPEEIRKPIFFGQSV
ncbi:hypothetical protein BOX30_06645 [Leptospirillum ferriphilum]|uniref:Uncharacterized protein n=1 Tax=Leptospirillum ferriphilum YSK TaxID=1441628 RepID=A0A059Y2R2_9BACT|nr:hypothetical protein Y981_09105 [Leptospirillum ferriphilum YSK]OOH79464.1 hypothetical protein BOX30_06645 [Leptospirillum ferriphilum]